MFGEERKYCVYPLTSYDYNEMERHKAIIHHQKRRKGIRERTFHAFYRAFIKKETTMIIA
jgi:hypothetical protein